MPDPHDEDKIEAEDLRRLIEQSENEESRWADRQQALEFLKQDLTVVIPIEPSAENEELRGVDWGMPYQPMQEVDAPRPIASAAMSGSSLTVRKSILSPAFFGEAARKRPCR
jgi:hypothetical protein